MRSRLHALANFLDLMSLQPELESAALRLDVDDVKRWVDGPQLLFGRPLAGVLSNRAHLVLRRWP